MCHCCHEILVIIIPWNMSKVSLLFFYIVIVSCQAVAIMINDSGLWHVVNVSLSLSFSLSCVFFAIRFFFSTRLSVWVMCVFFVFCWKQFIYAIDMFLPSLLSFFSAVFIYVCLLTFSLSLSHAKFRVLMWQLQGEKEIENFLIFWGEDWFEFEGNWILWERLLTCFDSVGAIKFILFNFKRQVSGIYCWN